MIELGIVCTTVLVMYFHTMRWLKEFFEQSNQLVIQKEIVKDLNEERQNKIRKVTEMVDDMRGEINALNLRLGMKLK